MSRNRPTATLSLNNQPATTYATVARALEVAQAQGFLIDWHQAVASLQQEGDAYEAQGPQGTVRINRGAGISTFPPYQQAVLLVNDAFASHKLEVDPKNETEASFLAKCAQADCLDAAKLSDASWSLHRPSVVGATYSPAQLSNFFADLRIHAFYGFLPR